MSVFSGFLVENVAVVAAAAVVVAAVVVVDVVVAAVVVVAVAGLLVGCRYASILTFEKQNCRKRKFSSFRSVTVVSFNTCRFCISPNKTTFS